MAFFYVSDCSTFLKDWSSHSHSPTKALLTFFFSRTFAAFFSLLGETNLKIVFDWETTTKVKKDNFLQNDAIKRLKNKVAVPWPDWRSAFHLLLDFSITEYKQQCWIPNYFPQRTYAFSSIFKRNRVYWLKLNTVLPAFLFLCEASHFPGSSQCQFNKGQHDAHFWYAEGYSCSSPVKTVVFVNIKSQKFSLNTNKLKTGVDMKDISAFLLSPKNMYVQNLSKLKICQPNVCFGLKSHFLYLLNYSLQFFFKYSQLVKYLIQPSTIL